MAFSFSKAFNTEKVFDIDTDGFDYKSLEELFIDEETVYPVRGLYINTKGLYDDAPLIATDEYYVNLPAHMVNSAREILNDRRAIKAINDGVVGFTIYKYHQKRYDKECYNIRWVDVDPAAMDM